MSEVRTFSITPTTRTDAEEIMRWRYEPPYDLYNPDPAAVEQDIAHFSDPATGYFSLRDETGELIAYVCYGEEARVPGGDYGGEALDVGCGTRPDLTGRGMGPSIIETAVRFGGERYGASRFRATIAAFNE